MLDFLVLLILTVVALTALFLGFTPELFAMLAGVKKDLMKTGLRMMMYRGYIRPSRFAIHFHIWVGALAFSGVITAVMDADITFITFLRVLITIGAIKIVKNNIACFRLNHEF